MGYTPNVRSDVSTIPRSGQVFGQGSTIDVHRPFTLTVECLVIAYSVHELGMAAQKSVAFSSCQRPMLQAFCVHTTRTVYMQSLYMQAEQNLDDHVFSSDTQQIEK